MPLSPQSTLREFSFSDAEFRFLAELAAEKTGIVLPVQKKDMVYARLVRRLRALGLDSFGAYCGILRSDAADGEIGNLVNAITTNLTSFFRESHHFDHLRDALQGKLEENPAARLRLWSAACSSGMEPYSMAMVLHGVLPPQGRVDARILATDIDTNMLAIGKAGIYGDEDIRTVPSAYARYIDRDSGSRAKITQPIRDLVVFNHLNLLETWPRKGMFDAVFCRNVVIYFDRDTKIKLFDRIADRLAPEGLLYIGHSENLNGISTRFSPVGRTIYRKIA